MKKNTKPILVSGMKPTGNLHLGNFLGSIRQVIELKDKYHCTFFIADLHAMTSVKDASLFLDNTRSLALDCLGAGIDPDKICFYKQSDIPEVTELCWYFNCIINVSYLMRAHAYKDAQSKKEEVNAGTFDYPILMAADILIHKAQFVPVGEDQRQHIEYARDVAEKFNSTYKEVFPVPEGIILGPVGTIPGTDGRKMSKSYGNTISLFAEPEDINQAVMKIPTDSKGVDEPKDPDSCSVFKLYSLVASHKETTSLKERYIKGGIGYKESKDLLSEKLSAYTQPFRERRQKYEKKPEEVERILSEGARKAGQRARSTIKEVRSSMGILFSE